MQPPPCLAVLTLAAACATGAHAQTAGVLKPYALSPPAMSSAPAAPLVGLSQAAVSASLPAARAQTPADAHAAYPQTALDHGFGGKATGSIGYLCGMDSFQPGSNGWVGPASAYGRANTFLGAKLSLAFR